MKRVPLVRPSLGAAEAEAAARVVRSGWVTQGPEVEAFEKEFAAIVGAQHAVAVANCTVALQLALEAAGVKRGDDVITVSHSFIATANAIVNVGANPVFVDVDRTTLGIDPDRIEEAITERTRAILVVHQVGMPCHLAEVLYLSRTRNLPVIEDAACAIGSQIWNGSWQPIGRPQGVSAAFSFHPRKVVTTGDGGMLTTSDESMARRFRLMRQHAMSIPDTVRHSATTPVFEEYLEPAFNYRMTDIQAAIGRPQLGRLREIVEERRAIADRFRRSLEKNTVLEPPREPEWARSNWQSFPVSLRPESGVSQVEAMQLLLDRGVACKRGISNAHQEPAYAARGCGVANCIHTDGHCPRLATSERLRDHTIFIPLFHGMTEEEQAQVLAACDELAAVRR